MILTRLQEEGLRIAVTRHKTKEKYTVISGYAGSGKSTLVRFIIDALDVAEDRVCYTAFTGKATEVLRKKGNKNACTLHKLLYEHVPLAAGGFFRKPKPTLDYDIIVVDEISMVPKEMIALLFTHQVYVICLGDPFQLPCIYKEEDNHLLDHPHIFLTEIMRQAQESEIIRLTMKIREMEDIGNNHNGQEVKILSMNQLNTGMLQWGDQVLVATNAKRQMINDQMRMLMGRGKDPEDGDKVICLRNYWDFDSEGGDVLVNGSIGILKNSFRTYRWIPRFIKSDIRRFEVLAGDLEIPETGDVFKNAEIDRQMLITGEKCCDARLSYTLGKLKPKFGEIVPKEFSYAYAITTHKAQGSEWSKVVVIEENFPFDKIEHARWLYTAATRASEQLVIIRNS